MVVVKASDAWLGKSSVFDKQGLLSRVACLTRSYSLDRFSAGRTGVDLLQLNTMS